MPTQQFMFSETSPAAPGTAVSSQVVTGSQSVGMPAGVAGIFDDYDSVDVVCELTGATGGTLNLYMQISPDLGTSWYDVISWQQAAGSAAVKYYQSPLSLATATSAPLQIGKNLVPALTAGGVVNGAFSDRCRLVMVAGSGTSVGAPVVVKLNAQRGRLREAGGA